MADEQKDQRTEAPTPRRLAEARRRGQVFKSQELNFAVMFLIFFLLLLILGGYFYQQFYLLSRNVFRNMFIELTPSATRELLIYYFGWSFKIVLPFLLLGMLAGIALNLMQVGFILTTEPLKPSWERLNPVAGFSRIFSKRNFVELAKNFLKFSLLALVIYLRIKSNLPLIFQKIGQAPAEYFNGYFSLIKKIALDTLLVLFVVGVVDYWYQRREYYQSLKMTKQELKEEYRQTEGDPLIKARLRERQRQIALNQIAREVPQATVVVTNPVHIAVALKYERGKMAAPKVVAKGAGFLAEKIKEIARAHNVEIVENVEVARFLYKNCEVGDEIPEELYNAVAEIIALVYRKKRKR
ncbi:flagellar biosynthesis protein FlhB [Carboxydothermus islandicus]|uniref:Flagellar biosynthetic protein FlhB n=2 Tax=Carboxydothermus islandicus TaxID=661089 RepID=A0A1L8D4S7_9THEO|nr:flagellar biosynthesis protein FlhB [Carboxydothermus islandicus]GAV26172.1 flagellar biosynthesis protein FlhB [Carboxydothermus islandicus]